ncbi:hypothetical protein Kpol_392p2 [Vanderwaltozyma polyspora DSM 70294]|uniref:SUI1 domain-containing protein n=1 Tax=Vanderwaltozyma polyspora (strain ATCC 22028 / DSM 70294 / BCRC 21397 / CBS 2163 / NBRC 10782 / NRRL Y-8283 / UCD 57-17) TaxID=436907 RepID=A7TRR3_VANPO|nr:uncharacterized protein Kpol_392p2 [Vanderwaltozyma polyspora DSM 70294]EDO15035.1 hypothetical protein Kpol_392p2 [Vanderwaltozyma polyspora DSM 70294]
MFKKTPHIKSLSNLKNSERKKLLQSCKAQTGSTDYNFPTSVIKQTNFNAQTSVGVIYTDEEGSPLWFKEKHSELLFPTVYTCWEDPTLLPIVLTHDIVINEHIFNGANLMISGTLPPFDSRLVPATICGIATRNNPNTIVAVGVVQLDMPSYSSVIGKTGVAVNVLHYWGDGMSVAFKMKRDIPTIVGGKDKSVDATENDQSPVIITEEEKTEDDSIPEISSNDVSELAQEESALTVEDIDHFITRSLYYTLTNDLKLAFPIPSSSFISNHIMRNLPPVDHNLVNIKKTSWKKSSKFLKHFEKEGFIKLKGKGEDLTIVGSNKEKEELKKFEPYRISNSSSNSGKKINSNRQESENMMYSLVFYSPKGSAKQFMTLTELPYKNWYTAIELKNAVTEYIKKKELVDKKNPKMANLDDRLYDMCYTKKSTNPPRHITRAAVIESFTTNNFTELYQLFKNDDTPLTKNPVRGSPPRIKIVTEMKIGRKIVTRVSNFESFGIDADALAGDLRRLCSGSTTIGETTTSPKTTEVQVQGPHSKIIIDHLNSLSIPTKWIDFENKLKPKKIRN